MYDANSTIIYQRKPTFTNFDDSGSIVVDNIETITFHTNDGEWFLGLINVRLDGVNQLFHCIDCISSSSSTDLGRLNMNGPQDLPGTANCRNTCTFRKGPAPKGKIKLLNQNISRPFITYPTLNFYAMIHPIFHLSQLCSRMGN